MLFICNFRINYNCTCFSVLNYCALLWNTKKLYSNINWKIAEYCDFYTFYRNLNLNSKTKLHLKIDNYNYEPLKRAPLHYLKNNCICLYSMWLYNFAINKTFYFFKNSYTCLGIRFSLLLLHIKKCFFFPNHLYNIDLCQTADITNRKIKKYISL